MQEIYLDNSATTKVCSSAVEAVVRAMQQDYGNAASLHKKGFQAEQLVTASRKIVAAALNCTEQEIYFTSGATESNNMSILGAARALKRRGNKIITTAIEHASVLEPLAFLENEGFEIVHLLPDTDGVYDAKSFYDAVDERTVLVSAMLVNNEVGLHLPIEEIAKAVKRKNPQTLMHTDAVQGFLRQPLKLKNSAIDLLSASGHKIYGPKGIGILYIKKGVRLAPILYGGGQQNGIRVGTENVPLIAGLGSAVKETLPQISQLNAHYLALKLHLLARLANCKDIQLNSNENCVPYIVNFSVERIRSEIMLHFLEQSAIYVSSGSACSKGAKSHVLAAMGLDNQRMDTALRLSFSAETTEADLDDFVKELEQGMKCLAKK